MNPEDQIKASLSEAFQQLFGHDLPPADITLQATRKDFAGHFTFVTFPYGRVTKLKPNQTADRLGAYLREHAPAVADYNVVKGFLNLEISDEVWRTRFEQMRQPGWEQSPARPERVVTEYSSPNTNKPLHLGHLRNNFLGDAVSRILKAAGHEVVETNLVNDRGIHICKSMVAYQRFGTGETPESAGQKGDHLVGHYYVRFAQEHKQQKKALLAAGRSEQEAEQTDIQQEAQRLLRAWEQGDEATVALWRQMNDWVYAGFHETYRRLGIGFDKFYYESDTYLLGKRMVEEGLEKGLFFRKEDGSVWVDLTDEGLDEKILLRADGTSVYMTQDMGTADLKYADFGAERSVYVVGNEQDYHFQVLFTILRKLGRPYADGLNHLSYGMVDLPSGRMKSREGTVVDADEMLDEMEQTAAARTAELGKIEDLSGPEAQELYRTLALGALKFFLLRVDPKKRMLFNPEESIDFQGHTGPFVQYTHARIAALLRRAEQEGLEEGWGEAYALQAPERDLIALLDAYPTRVREAAADYAPSGVAQYVYDVAREYNRFYAELSVFNDPDPQAARFRVALSRQVARVIRHGLGLLGIGSPERM